MTVREARGDRSGNEPSVAIAGDKPSSETAESPPLREKKERRERTREKEKGTSRMKERRRLEEAMQKKKMGQAHKDRTGTPGDHRSVRQDENLPQKAANRNWPPLTMPHRVS